MQERCVLSTRLQGAIVGNLPSGTLKRQLINLAACVHHQDRHRAFQTSYHAWEMKVQVAIQEPMEWVTNHMFLTGRHLQGFHNSELPLFLFFFLGKQLSLPFMFVECGGVPWTMTARQSFHTLRDCSVLGMVLIQHLLKSHTFSKESVGKVEGNVFLTSKTQKPKLLRNLKNISQSSMLPPGHQV